MPQAYHTQINDILLTALTLGVGDWTKVYNLSITLEGHGREEILQDMDLTRTLGWFTTIFPVNLSLKDPNNLPQAIRTIKEILHGIPQKGIAYSALTTLHKTQCSLTSPIPSLSFNYLGQWNKISLADAPFSLSKVLPSHCVSPLNIWPHVLSIDAEIRKNNLTFTWSYSENHYTEETVRGIAENCVSRLEQIIDHCCTLTSSSHSPSDFPLVKFTQDQIDQYFINLPFLDTAYPLTPMQLGFLFHSLYAPNSDAYMVQSIWNLEGVLDPNLLETAWQLITDQHDILRTGFLWKELETPVQYVLTSLKIPFVFLNWMSFPPTALKKQMETFFKEDRQKGFELNQAPLFRVTLIQTGSLSYTLIWTRHHIIIDGWSAATLLEELMCFYDCLIRKKRIYLPSRPPYRDYIHWINQQNFDDEASFWKKNLSGVTDPSRFSFKSIVRKNLRKEYDVYCLKMSKKHSAHIRTWAKNNNLSLNTLLQGMVALLIKFLYQNNFIMGMTFSGRTIDLSDVSEMVGLFINTLPLRITFEPKKSFSSFLKKLQRQIQELNAHAYVPLADIQTWSGLGSHLFDVLFVYEKYMKNVNDLTYPNGIKNTLYRRIEKTEYPLTIVVRRGGNRLQF